LGDPAAPAKRPRTPRDPDPDLFERRAGAWRLRIGFLVTPEASGQCARIAQGGEELPDDLLNTAARVGVLTCAAFLDILDGSSFVPAPCICCYAAVSAARAREAAATIRTFLQYYSAASYVQSRAYARTVRAMARDVEKDELIELKNVIYHSAGAGYTGDAREPALVQEVNAVVPGLCVAAPPCRPGVLWVYSTPDGRRLLRHLARKAKAPVRVTVASSDTAYVPRRRYRMYAATLLAAEKDAPTLLEETAAWARKQAHQVPHTTQGI